MENSGAIPCLDIDNVYNIISQQTTAFFQRAQTDLGIDNASANTVNESSNRANDENSNTANVP